MRRLILAAASAVALGIAGVGVGHAALTSNLAPSSASGKTTLWEQGYGTLGHRQIAPDFLLAKYQQPDRQQQAQSGPSSGQNIRRVPQQQWVSTAIRTLLIPAKYLCVRRA
jgi:hypothetical protein